MELLLQFGIFVVLLVIGLVFGRASEQRHLREIHRREVELRDVLVCNERRPPADREFREAALVVGSVVIAEDYFKHVAAVLRGFLGGRVTVYESLMERGRREAVLRMKEQARGRGATRVINVRFETSSLAGDGSSQWPMFSAEFIAYGTALVPR